MASTNQNIDLSSPSSERPGEGSSAGFSGLLVSLASLPQESLHTTLAHLAAAFPGESLLVATPDGSQAAPAGSNFRVLNYTPATPPVGSWVLTAADFLNAYELAQQHHATSILVLGPECQSIGISGLRLLADTVTRGGADLAAPFYELGAHEGLLNSALLYPVTRALFSTHPRFPLAVDLGLSLRMAERLAMVAQKFTATNQPEALLWPVAEAANAGFTVSEANVGTRTLPTPSVPDLNTLLAQIAGSLFSDVDAKATYWQRTRPSQPPHALDATQSHHPGAPADVKPMLDSFRLAYTNLHEIWSLVLPPASLLGLKRLSQMPPSAFRMADSLWVRIVYDFILAFRLRTLNRGHLLGALTPLYLAWVASHLLLVDSGVDAEAHIESLASAFEADKPYLVSRWRWPDRFNP